MLKVLIADDEEHVCKLIEKLIKWEELGLRLVSVVHSGNAALEAYRELQPDIIITDIRMPALSGIDLIKEVKRLNKETSFLVISGYRVFDYAYGALKNGADDYIVKPIKQNDINNALKRIVEKKNKTLKLESENREYKQKEIIYDLMQSPEKVEVCHSCQDINCHYNLNIKCNEVTVFILKIDLHGNIKIGENLNVIAEHVLHLLIQQMEKEGYAVYAAIYHDMIPVIIESDVLEHQVFFESLKKILKEIRLVEDKVIKVSSCIGIGGTGDISELSVLMDQAQYAVWDKLSGGNKKILVYHGRENEENIIFSDDLRTSLKSCVESLNYSGIMEIVTRLEDGFKNNNHNISGWQIYDAYRTLLENIVGILKKVDSKKELTEYAEGKLLELRMCAERSEMIRFIGTVIEEILFRIKKLEENLEKKPIRTAITYINEHYSENLSLENISTVVKLNSVYFSTMFKRETGKNFVEYLTEVRLEHAKKLLIESDYNISEIAWKVGYQDEKYFMKVFKREAGITCAKYRKLYG
ncbi:response regulator transcription factor [Ruminococcus gauvreauii]|uniref:Stage 0 sporulation protein A homolog n=1 Tax=Ruminococcus gauvreauii TaxID=438033 RepID=A0ABY5VER6_9FIRM|nr:response regulator [Ruminococcus gauvreauii]UWP58797.1 response regulator [Ruminococcus gauvreauii]